MKRFKLVNNITGWLVFLVAAITYCMTVEPSAPFWDCPEFTTTGARLEVGHPPGAPFFMLTANFFSHLHYAYEHAHHINSNFLSGKQIDESRSNYRCEQGRHTSHGNAKGNIAFGKIADDIARCATRATSYEYDSKGKFGRQLQHLTQKPSH